jgi:hypothetical protein
MFVIEHEYVSIDGRASVRLAESVSRKVGGTHSVWRRRYARAQHPAKWRGRVVCSCYRVAAPQRPRLHFQCSTVPWSKLETAA